MLNSQSNLKIAQSPLYIQYLSELFRSRFQLSIFYLFSFCIWYSKENQFIKALIGKTLFAIDYFKENINWEIVYNWCKNKLIPNLKNKSVIIFDNASFHKPKRIQKLLNRHGNSLLFLPPYSPNLNSIEHYASIALCLALVRSSASLLLRA